MAISERDLDNLTDAIKDLTDVVKHSNELNGITNTNGINGTTGTTGTDGTNSGATDVFSNMKRRSNQYWDRLEKEIDNSKWKDTKWAKDKKKEIAEARERNKEENAGMSKKDIERYNKRAKADKWQKGQAKAMGVINIIKGIADIVIAVEKRKIAIANAQVDYNAKMTELSLQRQTVMISNGVKNLTSGFSKTATEMAYDNTQSAYEISKTATITSQQEKIAGKTLEKETAKANAALGVAAIGAGAAIGAAIGSFIPVIGTAVGAIIGAIGGVLANIFSNAAELDIARKELNIKEAELASKVTESQLSQLQAFAKPFDDLYKQTSDFVLKLNDAGRKFGATIGYTSDDFAKNVINTTQKTVTGGKTLVELFGKESEKLHEYIGNYMEASGRQVNLSAEDYGNVMGTSKLFGISGAESAQLYGSMNIFNTSVSSAADSMGVMYHQITKMGLSTKKFSKDLVQNLKLAEKYNFKGGVENMMKMTKWAMQTRFNLNSAANFSESIQSGNLSEVLEKSAKLQVLGGSAGMYSDPFKLMYDAWNDTGDMAKRMSAMFNDITPKFDRKTGDVQFTGYENMKIANVAKALGMDPGEARNMLRQQAHQADINRVLQGTRLSDEDKVALGNRATWDVKNQRWVVTDKRGDTHNIMDYANGSANIEDLLPTDTNEAILEVVEDILSIQERMEHEQESNVTKMGAQEQDNIYKTTEREIKALDEFYKGYWGEMTKAFDASREHSETLFKDNIKLMEKLSGNLDILNNIYRGVEKDVLNQINTSNFGNVEEISIKYARGGGEAVGEYYRQKFTTTEDDGYGNINGGIITGVTGATSINDGVVNSDRLGNTSGGYIKNATSVRPINDGAVNVKTAKSDQYLAAMPNGPIDKILQQLIPGLQALLSGNYSNTGNNSLNINVGGKIMLEQGNSNVNLIDIIRNNPMVANKMVSLFERAVETKNNGKSVINYKL